MNMTRILRRSLTLGALPAAAFMRFMAPRASSRSNGSQCFGLRSSESLCDRASTRCPLELDDDCSGTENLKLFAASCCFSAKSFEPLATTAVPEDTTQRVFRLEKLNNAIRDARRSLREFEKVEENFVNGQTLWTALYGTVKRLEAKKRELKAAIRGAKSAVQQQRDLDDESDKVIPLAKPSNMARLADPKKAQKTRAALWARGAAMHPRDLRKTIENEAEDASYRVSDVQQMRWKLEALRDTGKPEEALAGVEKLLRSRNFRSLGSYPIDRDSELDKLRKMRTDLTPPKDPSSEAVNELLELFGNKDLGEWRRRYSEDSTTADPLSRVGSPWSTTSIESHSSRQGI